MFRAIVIACAIAASALATIPAAAQSNQREEAERRANVLRSLPDDAARRLFYQVPGPAQLAARSIGAYGRGCLAGATALAPDGPTWQAMRLSRNRNWGHPDLISWIERFARDVVEQDRWPGVLVGDISQARGGPMLTGHASHQMGLEADIWLTPAPRDRRLSREEREEMSAVNMVRSDLLDVTPAFTDAHVRFIRRAALSPQVDRIFVNAAIKKALCERAPANDRAWLRKVRPWYAHTFHMHVAIDCPANNASCRNQRAEIPPGDGCNDLAHWFREEIRFPRPNPNARAPRPWTMADLPAACHEVLVAR
jgi:penicillin-insensitive murein DD-endopeptidase